MKFVLFYHSLLSDWNHGNAHFLRGIVTELLARGHEVHVYEPRNAWSARNLLAEHGLEPVFRFHAAYPGLRARRYDLQRLDPEQALDGADVVLVHEWNEPALVARLGQCRARNGRFRLYFHDTHHRMVTDPQSMAGFDLTQYDGVLAYGRVLQEMYARKRAAARAWTWHEAADVRRFRPLPQIRPERDLVWIGNWGDGERTAELQEFLIRPAQALKLRARVYGVRYPDEARAELARAGIEYAGWLPNFEVPRAFALARVTVHVPRRPYVEALPGIPTIRPFEALACGIPLVCSPWDDAEHLFTPGRDYLLARNGAEMREQLATVLSDDSLRQALVAHGLKTIRAKHTCAHRVDQLLAIDSQVRGATPEPAIAEALGTSL